MHRTVLAVGVCLATVLSFARPADAALLTITDTYGASSTVWTLDVQTGCTTCNIMLTANFQDPPGAAVNGYDGSFIDAVQWRIAGSDPTAVNVLTAPEGAGNWQGQADKSLNANQCTGNANNNVCVQWTGAGGGTTPAEIAAGGYSPSQLGRF